MQKYTETEINSNESLIEYGYHIDDITLVGFKILSLPLKRSDWPNWFTNFNDKADVCLRYLNYSKEYICISDIANDYKRENTMYNHLSVGDYIIYDYRFDKVYATNSDSMLHLFKNITGYAYEQLLDVAFESDSNSSDTKEIEETSKRSQEINTLAKMFSDLVDNLVPKSREASLAQTKIEEAVMWANAGIARNITKED